jgi:hypothetical protein
MRAGPTILMLVVLLGCSVVPDGMLTSDCLLQASNSPRTKTPMTR